MIGQETLLRELDAAFTSALVAAGMGDAATYTAPAGGTAISCNVLVDHAVQFFGDDPQQIVGNRTVIRLQAAEVASPARGGIIAVGSRNYTLDKEIDVEPGISSRWVVLA